MPIDEGTCIYLREWAKILSGKADKAVFQHSMTEEAQNRIVMGYEAIKSRYSAIKKTVEKASKTPSKMKPVGVKL